jgi:hypothetical protein
MSVDRAGDVNASPSTSGYQYYQDPTLATRRLQNDTQYGSRSASGAYGAQIQSAADPNSAMPAFHNSSIDKPRLAVGMIVDGTPIANCYRVNVGGESDCPLIAAAAAHNSQAAFGATSISSYVPGTHVVVMIHNRAARGVILGSVPPFIDVGRVAYHDYISTASRKRVDDCHKRYLKMENAGEMVDYSNWRPVDGVQGSEWGAITTTGAAITLDDFMLRASINEFCGLYAFYHDQLVRLAGYNLQVWTAGSERDAYMDQGECNDTQGYTPYPWEGMGALEPGIPIIQQYEPKTYNCFSGKPYYSRWENIHEFAQPYHRSQTFNGYLGQGQRHVVHAPPPGLTRWTYKGNPGSPGPTPYDSNIEARGVPPISCSSGADKQKSHEEKPVYGLQEQNTGLDGRLFISSAKGVVISKRILLPIPQRIKRPEDVENGDEASKNYKAASKHGAGPEHKITGDFQTTDNDYPNMQRAAAVLDLHGYLFNYAGLHPFFWHAKDYKTWEQQDLRSEGYADYNQKIPQFDQLAGSKMYLKEETPKQWKIDHRYNTQKFWETESFISLVEDGTVVIADGYGAEIRMSGGCIFLSAPGDVWLKGGRDVQSWAGNDVILRANKSVDVSSTEKNVRIKAEEHVLVFAGNEESKHEGGILLESRGKTIEYDFEQCGDEVRFAGIVLRAPESNVVGLAHQIYMRTGGGEIKPGDIVLDAAKGKKDIITKSENSFHYVNKTGGVYHFFGDVQGGFTSLANAFKENVTVMCGPVGTTGSIFANGDVMCNGRAGFIAATGHVLTKKAGTGAIFVAPCEGECETQVKEAIDLFSQLVSEDIPDIGDQINETKLEMLWYTEKRAGNDDTINKIEFSFRRDEDYKIPDFVLYEDRWQQMARLGGQSPKTWTERAVKNKACGETWPFPGKKWLKDQPAYVEQDLSIVDTSGGFIDKQRGQAPGLTRDYAQPKFKPNGKKTLDGNYPITPRL